MTSRPEVMFQAKIDRSKFISVITCIFLSMGLISGVCFKSTASDVLDRETIFKGLVPITGESEITNRSIDLAVEFDLGKWFLNDRSKDQLDILARVLSKRLATSRFEINGHTDGSGDAESNRSLSLKRAQSVAGYLINERNIARERLDVNGLGEDELKNPLNPNAAENRRVEIVNITPAINREKNNTKTDYEAIN